MMGRYGFYPVDSENWNGMTDFMKEMMTPYRSGGGYVFWQLHWLFELVTWVLIIVLLVAAIRYLWMKADKLK